jgi:hypothetical protein
VGLKDQDQEELSHVDFARTFFLSGSCAQCAAQPHALLASLNSPDVANHHHDAAAPCGGGFSAGQAPTPSARKPRSSVARAAARTAARSPRRASKAPAAPSAAPATPPAAPKRGQDGLGLASMVRIDSLGQLPAGGIHPCFEQGGAPTEIVGCQCAA